MSFLSNLFSKPIRSMVTNSSDITNILVKTMKEKYSDDDKVKTIKLFSPILLNCTYTDINLILQELNTYGDSKVLALKILIPKCEPLTKEQIVELIKNHKYRFGSNLEFIKLLESGLPRPLDLNTIMRMDLDDETLIYILSRKGTGCENKKELLTYTSKIACQLFHVTEKHLTKLFLNYDVPDDVIRLSLEKRHEKEEEIKKFILDHSEDDGDTFTVKYNENDKVTKDLVNEVSRRHLYSSASHTVIGNKVTMELSDPISKIIFEK